MVFPSGVKHPGVKLTTRSASSSAYVKNVWSNTAGDFIFVTSSIISVLPHCCSYETAAMEQDPRSVSDGGAGPRSAGESSDPGRDDGSHHWTAAVLPVRMRIHPVLKCSGQLR